MYEVRLRSHRVRRELEALPEAEQKRILSHLKDLATDPRPHGAVKLEGDIYRLRVGDYRVIYLVDEVHRRVEIGAIRRRQESTYHRYRELF